MSADQQKRFSTPKLAINRVYTRRGDDGKTALVGGDRVRKDHPRVTAYGTVDELNAHIGLVLVAAEQLQQNVPRVVELSQSLRRVQHELFNLGSLLATPPEKLHEKQARIEPSDVERLEREIDRANDDLPELRSFILPGGSSLNAVLHVARTVCRRAERDCITLSDTEEVSPVAIHYLNRLSDALFVWSRWADVIQQRPEHLWDPNYNSEK